MKGFAILIRPSTETTTKRLNRYVEGEQSWLERAEQGGEDHETQGRHASHTNTASAVEEILVTTKDKFRKGRYTALVMVL
jgi:hypothetical protein